MWRSTGSSTGRRSPGRLYTELSGGERQLALIARVLAQEARILVMDEPTANLDYGNQHRVMAKVRRLAEAGDRCVVLTTHDPNHALQHATRALALRRGGGWEIDSPSDVVTEAFLRETYGVDAEIRELPRRGGVARVCVAGEH